MTDNIRSSIVTDPAVLAVAARLHATEQEFHWDSEPEVAFDNDPFAHPEIGFSLFPEQAEFLHLLVRFARPDVVVEFATSLGFSALYLASALKANGVGHLYGSEIVPEKARAALDNLEDAGLAEYVTILVGDARHELTSVDGPIDLLLIDGWPNDDESAPSVALEVLRTIEDRLRPGSLVVNDNGEDDYLSYVHDAANGYGSMVLPWKGQTEVSVRLR